MVIIIQNLLFLLQKIDQITNNFIYNQNLFDDIIELAKNKTKMLASIPAIQPVANKDLKRMTSGLWPQNSSYL